MPHAHASGFPSPSNDRGGNPLGCADGIRGPRATVIVQDKIAGDRPPRDGCQGRLCFNVARGPVPRHANRLKQDFYDYHD